MPSLRLQLAGSVGRSFGLRASRGCLRLLRFVNRKSVLDPFMTKAQGLLCEPACFVDLSHSSASLRKDWKEHCMWASEMLALMIVWWQTRAVWPSPQYITGFVLWNRGDFGQPKPPSEDHVDKASRHRTGEVLNRNMFPCPRPVHSSDDKSLLAKGVQRTQSSLSHVTYTTRASLIPLLSFLTVPEISNRYAEMHASWLAEQSSRDARNPRARSQNVPKVLGVRRLSARFL